MNLGDVIRLRIHNQCIVETVFERPEEVISWFGAVQAQDYLAAKWSVGLRSNGLSESSLDLALAEGKILRTHVLRPTWHFVTQADIGWMLELSAQRVHKQMAHWYRSASLDNAFFKKTNRIIANTLQGGKQLTRSEIASLLKQSNVGVEINNLRLTFIMLHAEVDGIICSGALKGKAHTYAFLDDRVTKTKKLTHEESLVELTKRYFVSRGPATVKDYAWWSSLSMAEAKAGVEMVTPKLAHEIINKQDYSFFGNENFRADSSEAVYLLPNFDEYIIGYTDRSAIFESPYASGLDARHNPLFQNTIVTDDRIVGTWKRILQKNKVSIVAKPFLKLPDSKLELLMQAVMRYSRFIEKPVDLVIDTHS